MRSPVTLPLLRIQNRLRALRVWLAGGPAWYIHNPTTPQQRRMANLLREILQQQRASRQRGDALMGQAVGPKTAQQRPQRVTVNAPAVDIPLPKPAGTAKRAFTTRGAA